MDIYKYINKYIIAPLYYLKHSDERVKQSDILEKNQYLTTKDLNSLALKKIQAIVTHAYKTTPYYRNLLDSNGIKPEDIKGFSDFNKIPILTKNNIQNNLHDMKSDCYSDNDMLQDASGGSTGEPTVFYRDKQSYQFRAADQIRHDRWSGWDRGERIALIWGAQRDLKASQSIREHVISRYISRMWELDAFDMSQENMKKYARTLEKVQPQMILGYANALVIFSEYILKHHPDHKIAVKGIISSAETLTEEKRATIEKAFHCKVLNRYGSREVGLIASECKSQKGLHINFDNLYVEVVNDGQPVEDGEFGDILVTDYNNKGMPLIRYKLGDVGRLSSKVCDCGRTLPLLESIEGRNGDFFVAQDGSLVHGEYFTHLFYGIEDISKFQVIQENMNETYIKIVTSNEDVNSENIQNIITKTKGILGKNCRVIIQFVTDIPKTSSGKYIFTISKVRS